jgi:hypothetical protein
MKKTLKTLLRIGWVLPLVGIFVLASASSAMGQDDSRVPMAFMGAFIVVGIVIVAALYVYMALALQTIATKTNTENPWLAWIPIVHIILMLNIAKKPIWWFILFFIPLVGIVMAIIVWMGIAEARNKPNWWGILIIVPVVGIIVPGYLAWSD